MGIWKTSSLECTGNMKKLLRVIGPGCPLHCWPWILFLPWQLLFLQLQILMRSGYGSSCSSSCENVWSLFYLQMTGGVSITWPLANMNSLLLPLACEPVSWMRVGPSGVGLCSVWEALLRPILAHPLNYNVLPLSPSSFSGILSTEILKQLSKEGPEVFTHGQEEWLV